MKFAVTTSILALAGAACLGACSDDGGSSTTTDTIQTDATATIYAQLGGNAGITAFIDGLITEELKDPSIAPYFTGLGTGTAPTAGQLKACLVAQIGKATGGPEAYPTTVAVDGGFTCRDMAEAHKDNHIKKADFDKFIAITAQFAADQGVPADIIGVLGTFLGDQEEDIVEQEQTIYQRLGEEAGIAAFVHGLVVEELKDPDIAAHFADLGMAGHPTAAQLEACLTAQVGNATGGPQAYPTTVTVGGSYTCRDMAAAHAGLGITKAEFDKFISIASTFASDQDVPSDILIVLGGFLTGFESDIVEVQ